MKEKKSLSLPLLPLALVLLLVALGLLSETLSAGTFLTPSQALAEDSTKKSGRLSDGRAYRVDQNGLQLVDYIAELEVAKDDLQRQVRALEDELIEKNRTLDRVSKGQPLPKAAVREQEITGGASQSAAALSMCQSSLTQAQTRLHQMQAQLQAPRCNFESAENPYIQETTRLRAQLRDLSAERTAKADQVAHTESARESSEKQLELAKSKVTSQQMKIAEQEDKLADQEARLRNLEQQLAAVRATADSAVVKNEVPAQEKIARGAMSAPRESMVALTETAPSEVADSRRSATREMEQKPSKSRPSVEVLAQARSELRGDLQKIQDLISQRKSLFDSAARKGSGISIKIQPLVSKDGVSLDNLRLSVERLGADSDIAAIRTGLADIKGLLGEDIGVLSRIGKL